MQEVHAEVREKLAIHEEDALSQVMILNEISSILYQVTDYDTALDMILDTCTEYLKIPKAGIITEDPTSGDYKIIKGRNLSTTLEEQFQFQLTDKFNEQSLSLEKQTKVEVKDSILQIGNRDRISFENISSAYFFPVIFRDKLMGFLTVFYPQDTQLPEENHLKLLELISVQIAPVLFSFDSVRKPDQGSESIIGKIIRDRMYEAQLVLSPIVFTLFRIVPVGKFEHSLPLESAVKNYQNLFQERLSVLGDLIWLTLDTLFFVYPKADLFKAETLCSELQQNIESMDTNSDQNITFTLKYVCLGYPQSGKNSSEIINMLWLKLFDELSDLKSTSEIMDQNSVK